MDAISQAVSRVKSFGQTLSQNVSWAGQQANQNIVQPTLNAASRTLNQAASSSQPIVNTLARDSVSAGLAVNKFMDFKQTPVMLSKQGVQNYGSAVVKSTLPLLKVATAPLVSKSTYAGTAILGGGLNALIKGGSNLMENKPVQEGVLEAVNQGAQTGIVNAPLTNMITRASNPAILTVTNKVLSKLPTHLTKNLSSRGIDVISRIMQGTLAVPQGKAIASAMGTEYKLIDAAIDFAVGSGLAQKTGQKSIDFAKNGAFGEGQKGAISLEGIAESGAGWKAGDKAIFDNAVISKDKEAIKALLPTVPQEYKLKFAQEISAVLDSAPVAAKEITITPELQAQIDKVKAGQGIIDTPSGKQRGLVTSVKTAENISPEVRSQVQGTYAPKANPDLMGEAKALLSDGATIDFKNVKDLDQKVAATIQQAINNQKTDPQAAANLFNNLSEQGTELGRAVQAFSMLTKMSPEAIALSVAGKIKKYNLAHGGSSIPELNGEQVRLINDQVNVIQKMTDGREKNIAINSLQETLADFIPSSLGDKAIAVWKAGLLTSLRTTERNVLGNTIHGVAEIVKDIPATIADMGMSLATGKRTLTPTMQGVGEFGSKKTVQEMKDLAFKGFNAADDMAKFDQRRITWGKNPVEQLLKKYTDLVFRSLGAQDRPFYNAAFARSLYDQAGAAAINAGKSGDKTFIKSLVDVPTPDMLKTAINDANTATFKNKNITTGVVDAIKRGMSKNEWTKLAGEITMPFTGVPTSILGQAIEYSPIGLLKGISTAGRVTLGNMPELQRKAAQEIGRGIIGTGVFSLGSYLYQKGLITGQPKDATEQRQWDLENKPRNSIMIDGKWRSLNSIGPEALVFLAGSKLQQEMQDPEGSVAEYGLKLGKDYLDQSFVTGIQQPINALTDPGRYGKSYAGGLTSSVVPNIVKDSAKALDDKQRESNTVTDYAKFAIPGVRNTLIEKRDTLGNVMPQEPTGLSAFFDLFNSKTPVNNAVVSELSRLNDIDSNSTPSKLTTDQTIMKQKVKLTFEQLNQLEKGVGEMLRPKLAELIQSGAYQQSDDETKAGAIDKLVQMVRKQFKNNNADSILSGSPTSQTKPTTSGQSIYINDKNGNIKEIDLSSQITPPKLTGKQVDQKGQTVFYLDDKKEVKTVDLSFQPKTPKLTGLVDLDKQLVSTFHGDITKKQNDIVQLYTVGKLTAEQASTQLAELTAKKFTKVKGAKKVRMPKIPKISSRKIRVRTGRTPKLKLRLPKLAKIKLNARSK